MFSLNNAEELDLEQFVLAFPTDLAPIVGQQVTIGPGNFGVADVNDRITLIDTRANITFESKVLGGSVTECDVIAKTVEGGVEKGYTRPEQRLPILPDDDGPPSARPPCAPRRTRAATHRPSPTRPCRPGSGVRMGIDRDEDTDLERRRDQLPGRS